MATRHAARAESWIVRGVPDGLFQAVDSPAVEAESAHRAALRFEQHLVQDWQQRRRPNAAHERVARGRGVAVTVAKRRALPDGVSVCVCVCVWV